jgi:hypothetical protein
MKLGPRPDAMEPDIHGVRTQWIRGFMAFWLARRTRTVRLMVLMRLVGILRSRRDLLEPYG